MNEAGTAKPGVSRRLRSLHCAAALALISGLCFAHPADAFQFAVVEDRIQINQEQIMSWIFGNQQSLDQIRLELDEILQTRVDLIAAACGLSPEQRDKLFLAGAGDIHRFFNEYQTLRRSIPTGSITQAEYMQMWQDIQPFRQKYNAGLFSRDSLLNKTVPYVLQEHQVSRYEEFERLRLQRYYESVVRGTIAMMEDELPLTTRQREKLLKVVLARNIEINAHQNSYYQMYAVLYQISKIPEDELKPIFLENEWAIMKAFLQNARGYEHMLKQEGILD